MNAEPLTAALLQTEGYATFESLGEGNLRLLGPPPRFLAELLGEQVLADEPLRPGDSMPFLENFLFEAEELWNSGNEGRAESGAWVETAPDGREIALEASAFLLGSRKILLIRNSQQRFDADVAILQKARDSLLEHERLLKEIQKKEILLHCIIHDLSQPLTAMRGCFSVLAMEPLAPNVKELVEIGHRQSENQEQMIRGILEAFSSELAAQQSFQKNATDAPSIPKVAGDIARDYSAAFAEHGAKIQLDPRMDLAKDWKVVGDEGRLRRIFTNLVENALRYSPAGSTVTLGAGDEGNFLRAFVDDEGPGLPEGEAPARMFALFAKGKTGGGKAGLGLYFCRITVERWGGTIGAERRPEKGSRFWFRLPRAQTPAASEPSASPATPSVDEAAARQPPETPEAISSQRELSDKPRSAHGLRILLAEDTVVNQQVVGLLLDRRGHSVLAVSNGKLALAALEKEPFDLILMDVEMPEMGGFEATRAIREMEKTSGRHIPIVAMTGHDSPAERSQCLAAGMDDHVGKPIDPARLFAAVEGNAPRRESLSAGEKSPRTADSFDPAGLLARMGGSEKLARDLARAFLADLPGRMASLRNAISQNDAEALASAAHTLKGSVGYFGAADTVETARKLELLGRSGSTAGAAESAALLEAQFARLADSLRAFADPQRRTSAPAKTARRKFKRR
ncbi:MAG: response regulator [Candidatus Acidiferrales bacterium]